MYRWVSEIYNDKAIGNIRTNIKFPPGQADLISQLEGECMTQQSQKRARKGEDNDLPSDDITVIKPEFPKGASIWWVSAEACKLFNSKPNETALEDLKIFLIY